MSDGVHAQEISVTFEYPVHFTRNAFAPENETLLRAIARREPERAHRVFSVVDGGLAQANPAIVEQVLSYADRHRPKLCLVARPQIVPGGEVTKNEPCWPSMLHHRFAELNLDRQSVIVIVGGGALLDMAGFAAATAHRGLRIVRLPTTVLSQADSGVGVKNGINAFGKKNYVGTFAPPFAVVCDGSFLRTLSPRDRRAGVAEAVKVALIRAPALFEWIRRNAAALAGGDLDALGIVVRRSAELHLEHIATSGDPFELGSARPLDFGHWSAHKIEALSEFRLRHGEAVAIGMALDTLYARDEGLIDDASAEVVLGTLERLGFRLWDESLELADASGHLRILEGLAEFREHLGGELSITLLRRIGEGVEVHEVREDLVAHALHDLQLRQATAVAPDAAALSGAYA